jgi:hypothetical protein
LSTPVLDYGWFVISVLEELAALCRNHGLEGDTLEKQVLLNALHHRCCSAMKTCGDFKLLWHMYLLCSAKTSAIDTTYVNNLMNMTE